MSKLGGSIAFRREYVVSGPSELADEQLAEAAGLASHKPSQSQHSLVFILGSAMRIAMREIMAT